MKKKIEDRPFQNLPKMRRNESLFHFLARRKKAFEKDVEKYSEWLDKNYPPHKLEDL